MIITLECVHVHVQYICMCTLTVYLRGFLQENMVENILTGVCRLIIHHASLLLFNCATAISVSSANQTMVPGSTYGVCVGYVLSTGNSGF